MAYQSPVIFLKKLDRQAKDSKIAIELSKSLIDEGNKFSFSGNHDSLALKKMDSTRILGSEIIDGNQDHKRRCFEKLVAEVIDDTALIETTVVVTGFKNCYRIETDVGFGNHPGKTIVSRNQKQEGDGKEKKKKNKGIMKQVERCSMKCLNKKKSTEKKISDGNGQKVYRKLPAKVKCGYQRKNTKNLKSVATGDEEHQEVKNRDVLEKIFGEATQETDVNLLVATGIENELAIKYLDTETVTEKDDGFELNHVIAVNTKNNEAEDPNEIENTTVRSKKTVYSREKMESLRFVDEEGQKSKWVEVYSGFAPTVAREYTRLVVDANNRLTQRYNRPINCGSTRHANVTHSMPPVLPLCPPSNCKWSAPYDHIGFRENFN